MIRQTATVSIDIGHSNLKMVQTASDGRILRFVVHKMPEGCVEDVNILSEDALIHSLKTARHTAHLSGGEAVTSSSAAVISSSVTSRCPSSPKRSFTRTS